MSRKRKTGINGFGAVQGSSFSRFSVLSVSNGFVPSDLLVSFGVGRVTGHFFISQLDFKKIENSRVGYEHAFLGRTGGSFEGWC